MSSSFQIVYKKDFYHNYVYDIDVSTDFSWKIGNLSTYWFQVRGCCKKTYDTCPPFKTDDLNCNKSNSQFIQTILAYSPQEVCTELVNNKWNWNICEMQRWARPAENEFIGAGENDDCNYLQNIDFKNFSECLPLMIDDRINMNIRFNSSINYTKCGYDGCYSYVSVSGKVSFSSIVETAVISSLGQSVKTLNNDFSNDSLATILFSGESVLKSIFYYEISANFQLNSNSTALIKTYKYLSEPDLIFEGSAIYVKDNWFYYPFLFDLNFELYSKIKINFSDLFLVNIKFESNSDFKYLINLKHDSVGQISFASSSTSKKNTSYSSNGFLNIEPSSYYGSFGKYNINIRYLDFVEVKNFIASDENEFLNDASYVPDSISVGCYNCGSIPYSLYHYNNLNNLRYLNEFLNRNELEIDQYLFLNYSSVNESWGYFFSGGDASEEWKYFHKISCYKDENIDYSWKYDFRATRIKNNKKFESRLTVSVPSEFVCSYNSNFDFSFNFNVLTKKVFINLNTNYDDFVFYDNIGLFDSNYWKIYPNIKIKVATTPIDLNITRKTISV